MKKSNGFSFNDFDNNLIKRLVSSIIIVIATISCLYYGRIVATVFFSLCFMFAIAEWYNISLNMCKNFGWFADDSINDNSEPDMHNQNKAFKQKKKMIFNISAFDIHKMLFLLMFFLGASYIFSGLFFLSFHAFFCHYNVVFYLIAVVWITDTAAYIGGKLVGGLKMAPRISPGKTWSGFFIGITVSYAGIIVFSACTMDHILWTSGIILPVVSQMGDLLESFCKRKAKMKDSGTLIPGHGGILDRIDGLLAVSICYALT